MVEFKEVKKMALKPISTSYPMHKWYQDIKDQPEDVKIAMLSFLELHHWRLVNLE